MLQIDHLSPEIICLFAEGLPVPGGCLPQCSNFSFLNSWIECWWQGIRNRKRIYPCCILAFALYLLKTYSLVIKKKMSWENFENASKSTISATFSQPVILLVQTAVMFILIRLTLYWVLLILTINQQLFNLQEQEWQKPKLNANFRFFLVLGKTMLHSICFHSFSL